MSREYRVSVVVDDFNPERAAAIAAAAQEEWPGLSLYQSLVAVSLHGEADGSLTGGESEDEFVDRLGQAICRANGDYCVIHVYLTYLEDPPYNTYIFDKDDYERLVLQNRENEEQA